MKQVEQAGKRFGVVAADLCVLGTVGNDVGQIARVVEVAGGVDLRRIGDAAVLGARKLAGLAEDVEDRSGSVFGSLGHREPFVGIGRIILVMQGAAAGAIGGGVAERGA